MRISDWSSDVFSSDLIPFAEYRKFIGWRNSVDNFWLAAARTLAYARDRLLRRRARLLANGHALVGRLLKSALAAGVSPRHNRSDRRRVGKEWVSTFRTGWSP